MAATGEAITSQSPVTGFQPGSPERPSGSPERPSGCGVDESRVVQGGGRRTERSSVEGRAGLRALPSQPPPEHSGLATEAAPRPGGASTVPSTVPRAVLGVQGGGGGRGGEPAAPEAGRAALPVSPAEQDRQWGLTVGRLGPRWA